MYGIFYFKKQNKMVETCTHCSKTEYYAKEDVTMAFHGSVVSGYCCKNYFKRDYMQISSQPPKNRCCDKKNMECIYVCR